MVIHSLDEADASDGDMLVYSGKDDVRMATTELDVRFKGEIIAVVT